MAVDLDVVVDVHPDGLPLREDVGAVGQRAQGRPVELLVEGAAADAELLQRPVVERVEEDADRPVQGAELEEGLVTEPGEYPPLGDGASELVGDPQGGRAPEYSIMRTWASTQQATAGSRSPRRR